MTMTGADAELTRGEDLYRRGDYAAAAARLTPLATGGRPHPTAMRMLAMCRLRQGQVATALDQLERALGLAPDDPLTQLHLGLALQVTGRFQEAAQLFERCCGSLPDDPAPPLNLATALLGLGQPQAAVRAASQACFRAPQMAEAHYTYGLTWLALGESDRAGQAFVAAVQIRPAFADAWLNLGLARYRAGDLEAAKTATREALQVSPGHPAATANLAAFLRLTGEGGASEQLLVNHLAHHPGSAEARLNLAADLLSEERADEALALLDGPLPGGRRLRQHWRLQQSLALLQLRRPAQARRTLEDLGEVSADMVHMIYWREILFALNDGDIAQARVAADGMEQALDAFAEALVPEHAIMARYDLAKFWSMQAEPDRAFPQWAEGHRLLRRFQPFSRPIFQDFIDADVSEFSRARLTQGPRASNADPAPVFIVGMPRSGTTLAEQILAAHGQVHGAGERSALGAMFAELGGGWETAEAARRVAALDTPALDAAAERYLTALHALDPAARRIVDKMPGNFRHLGLVGLMLPGARIIHCVRDPRDVGLSVFTFRFHGHHPYAHDLSDLGWYISRQDRLMAHWRACLPNPVLTLRLNDWIENFPATVARVLAFMDLPHDPACERFYEGKSRVRTVSRAQVRQPINARGIGRWRAYASHLEPLIAELDAEGALQAWDAAGRAAAS